MATKLVELAFRRIVALLDEQPVLCSLKWFSGPGNGVWKPEGESVYVTYLPRNKATVAKFGWPGDVSVVRVEVTVIAPSDAWLRNGGLPPSRRTVVQRDNTVPLRLVRGPTDA